jgi:CRISPR/Cas system-associated exonuclease Cas4 (RecB family)
MPKKFQSPTSINTYLRCPRKYYLRYIKGLKSKPSIHLIRGKAVHETIAQFSQMNFDRSADQQTLDNSILGLFEKNWLTQNGDIQKLGLDRKTINEFYSDSQAMLTGWLKRYFQVGYKRPKTETKLFSKTHGVMGIIDAIFTDNGRILLIDYKTGKKNEITADIKVQLAIYALLYKEKFGRMPDIVAIDFLKHQEERRFRASEKLIQYAAQLCLDTHKKTISNNEKDYPCQCGGWCDKEFMMDNGGG